MELNEENYNLYRLNCYCLGDSWFEKFTPYTYKEWVKENGLYYGGKFNLIDEVYLECGVYNHNGHDLLFIATPGYFASTAWCESDEAYNNVSGTKFEGITSDDCCSWRLDRFNIRRIKDDEELNRLFNNSCNNFKNIFISKFYNGSKEK